MSATTLPTLHWNGTSKSALFEVNVEAAGAIRAALERLGEAAPNARDFYPQGPDAYGRARAEHDARAEALRAVLKDFEAICEHIAQREVEARR